MDSILNNAPCGFLSFDDEGRILDANETLLSFLGYSREELVALRVVSILSVGARFFYQTHFFPLLKLHGRVEEIYLSLRSSRGEDIPVLLNGLRVARNGVTVNDCIAMVVRQRSQFEDELLKARKDALEANRVKERFLSMMSHELRTPLNAIVGLTEILTQEIHGPITPEQREDLEYIDHASQDLLRLIEDMMRVAQLRSEPMRISTQILDLAQLRVQFENLIAKHFSSANIRVEFLENDPRLRAVADPTLLDQILINLFRNAIEFAPSIEGIVISCDTTESTVQIHVKDHGDGIPAGHLSQIFDPFTQLDRRNHASNKRGVGLGLAISRNLARAMHGDLTVTSSLGQGSTFTISLPQRQTGPTVL